MKKLFLVLIVSTALLGTSCTKEAIRKSAEKIQYDTDSIIAVRDQVLVILNNNQEKVVEEQKIIKGRVWSLEKKTQSQKVVIDSLVKALKTQPVADDDDGDDWGDDGW